jgi:hypothetical protein
MVYEWVGDSRFVPNVGSFKAGDVMPLLSEDLASQLLAQGLIAPEQETEK